MRNRFTALAVAGLVTAAAAVPAYAIDVSDVVTEIQATAAPIGAIGAAVLIVIVSIKAFKWVRRAF